MEYNNNLKFFILSSNNNSGDKVDIVKNKLNLNVLYIINQKYTLFYEKELLHHTTENSSIKAVL